MRMGYTLIYGLINFAILATALYFIGRKLVPKMLGGRRAQVEESLQAADAASANAKTLLDGIDQTNADAEKECAGILSAARESAAAEKERAEAMSRKTLDELNADNEKSLQYQTKSARTALTRDTMEEVINQAAVLLADEKYADARARMTERLIDRAEKKLRITRGDLMAFQEKGFIPVEMHGVTETPEKDIVRVKAAILHALHEAGETATEDQIRITTGADESLIGGAYLKVGDTVYDSTLKGMLQRVRDSVNVLEHDDEALIDALKEELAKAGSFQIGAEQDEQINERRRYAHRHAEDTFRREVQMAYQFVKTYTAVRHDAGHIGTGKSICQEDQIRITTGADESLIGGAYLKVGDTVYDSTLKGMLQRVRDSVSVLEHDDEALIDALKEELAKADNETAVYQKGTVISVSDGICRIAGVSDAMAGELIEFNRDLRGMVMDLEKDNIGVVLLGDYSGLQEGDEVRRSGRIIEVPVGEEMIGRVVDSLGNPIDGGGEIHTTETRPIESPAPGVISRRPVSVPMQTGIKAIDALVPIGRGQRELIIGDRQTGKTAIAIDTIINQKGKDMICIYVAIGQKESTVAGCVQKLREHDAMDYTIVVCASASESAPMLYIAPYAGAAMGEYFMHKGGCPHHL